MHFDLVIVGTGSGNTILGREYQDLTVAIVEAGKFGGTCLNVGCIPTKMYVYPADVAEAARRAGPLGVHATIDSIDSAGIRERIFSRVDEISEGGLRYREGPEWPNLTVYTGTGRFTGHKAMTVDLADGRSVEITADKFVLAAGGRPVIPDIPGLDEDMVGHGPIHTSDTIMRIDKRPKRLIVVGGGYIAAEFAHVFAAFGVEVTQLVRGPGCCGIMTSTSRMPSPRLRRSGTTCAGTPISAASNRPPPAARASASSSKALTAKPPSTPTCC